MSSEKESISSSSPPTDPDYPTWSPSLVSYRSTPKPYILWGGDDHPVLLDFSDFKSRNIGDVIRRFKGIVENGTLLNFIIDDDEKNLPKSLEADGLDSLLRRLVNSNGVIDRYKDDEWIRLQIRKVKFTDSDDDEEREKRTKRRCVDHQEKEVFNSDIKKGYVQCRVRDLALAHTNLLAKTDPFYGNDMIKIFIMDFIKYCLYDKADYSIQENTSIDDTQMIRMEHAALHEATYEELILKGMPDVAVKIRDYRRLIFEGKSSGDDTSGEGQIVMAMLTEFTNSDLKEVYGILLSPVQIRVYQVCKSGDNIVIHRLSSYLHTGKNLLALTKLIYWTRHACIDIDEE